MTQAGVNVEQLVEALKRKGIPLPFEMGTFVALEACERVVSAPVSVTASEIWLSEDGEVTVAAAKRAESEEAACRGLVELVGQLLVQSAPGVPPALLALVERGPSSGEWSLRSLRDDLEAALVPLNRAATRRVLSRLLREARRERASARAAASVDAGTLQDELDELLGVDRNDPGLSRDQGPPANRARATASRVESFANAHGAPAPAPPASGREMQPEPATRQPTPQRDSAGHSRAEHSPPADSATAGRPRLDEHDLADFDRAAGGRAGLRIGLALVVAALVLAVAYLWWGREAAREALGISAAPPPQVAPEPAAPRAPAYGELRVTSDPARAQVLLYVGEAPVVVKDLPVGAAHEFVALADGAAPARAVVPADAAWQQEAGKLRYELALQTAPATKQRPADELGATTLPSQAGAPKGVLGDVRVITSPPGAKVYLLVGFTPDVQVDNVSLDEAAELLLYLDSHKLERVKVDKDAYRDEDGKPVAALDVALQPKR